MRLFRRRLKALLGLARHYFFFRAKKSMSVNTTTKATITIRKNFTTCHI